MIITPNDASYLKLNAKFDGRSLKNTEIHYQAKLVKRDSIINLGEYHFLNYETKRSHEFKKLWVTKQSDVLSFRPKFKSVQKLCTKTDGNIIVYDVSIGLDMIDTS